MFTEKTPLLSSVCEIVMGQAPDGSSYNTHSNGYPLIAGAGDFGALFPNPGKFTDAPTKLSHDGDIILCIRATIGDRNWSDTSYCLGRGVAGLRAKNGKLFQGYLWHWLGHTAPELKAKGRGATFLQVSKSDIGSLQIPLPPIEEQKRIAAILDAADALRVKRRESIAQLDALLQSTFLDMFGDPVRNPKGWETVRFEEIGASRLGKMLDKGREKGSCQYTYLANFNVQWFHFDLENLRTMDFCNSDREEFNLQKGDLLVCEGGEVGRTAIWKGEQEDVFFQKALHRVRLDPEKAVAEYVQFFMWFMAKNGGFKDFTNSATIAHLTGVKLKTLPVPLPPLSLQRRFASIVEAAERQKARLRAHLDELDALFSSLQSRAFNGEL
ncbi:MAG: restriction endonuclease [Bacteroidia bacterium]|nr:restriction endonuclease [Bacteroidia bacterium]